MKHLCCLYIRKAVDMLERLAITCRELVKEPSTALWRFRGRGTTSTDAIGSEGEEDSAKMGGNDGGRLGHGPSQQSAYLLLSQVPTVAQSCSFVISF